MTTAVNHVTGEVIDVTAHAAEYERVSLAVQEAREELERLERIQRTIRRDILAAVPVDSAVPCGNGRTLTVTPGPAGRRIVDKGVASENREALLDVGLGSVVEEYRPPTLAEVNAARAELVAAGVPIHTLIREPQPAEPVITIIRGN